MLFAYINDTTCFGTIAEIGYAKRAGKPVVVMFASNQLLDDMWFIGECADGVFVRDDVEKKRVIGRKPIPYIIEAVWIANRIMRIIHNSEGWALRKQATEEEITFNEMYGHLQPKERYQEYLKTNWWQTIRIERLKIDGYKCTCCGTEKNLQVHHTDYSKGWFHEDPRQDLVTLCRKCHEEKVHGNK